MVRAQESGRQRSDSSSSLKENRPRTKKRTAKKVKLQLLVATDAVSSIRSLLRQLQRAGLNLDVQEEPVQPRRTGGAAATTTPAAATTPVQPRLVKAIKCDPDVDHDVYGDEDEDCDEEYGEANRDIVERPDMECTCSVCIPVWPWGMHRGTPIKDTPGGYVHWLCKVPHFFDGSPAKVRLLKQLIAAGKVKITNRVAAESPYVHVVPRIPKKYPYGYWAYCG